MYLPLPHFQHHLLGKAPPLCQRFSPYLVPPAAGSRLGPSTHPHTQSSEAVLPPLLPTTLPINLLHSVPPEASELSQSMVLSSTTLKFRMFFFTKTPSDSFCKVIVVHCLYTKTLPICIIHSEEKHTGKSLGFKKIILNAT